MNVLGNKFNKRIEECLVQASSTYGNILNIPHKQSILLNYEFMDFSTLAHATNVPWNKHVKSIISLNAVRASEHQEFYKELIIPHELAHIICFHNDMNDGHGSTWAELCVTMGGSEDPTLNVSD